MAHILLPLGYHSVQSKLISCALVQIHDIALHIHNNNCPKSKRTRILSREDYWPVLWWSRSFGMEVRCWKWYPRVQKK